MTLRLIREPSMDGCTMGSLYVDGVWECWALEDPIRDVKIAGETAIPAGRYRVTVTHSPRFGRPMPLLHDVPGFAGVRIHAGNKAADTEGCILPGRSRGKASVYESRMAYEALLAKIRIAGEAWIEVEDPR